MLVVERDIGHMIVNVPCLPPVHLRKTRDVQLVYMVGQNVLLPMESAGQTLLTPIASAASTAVDTGTGGISDAHAMDDNDEPWLSETDHKSGWNTKFKSVTYRGMLYGIVLRRWSRQRACQQTCVNFSLWHRSE